MASLPLFFEEVPEFEIRGEFIVVTWNEFQLAMPVSVCELSVAECNRALDTWHERVAASVLRFPRREH